jgi:GntR family histidine utilization transcriptional repressor
VSAFVLDGEGALHAQIRRAVAGAILSGKIPPGGRVPPEADLMRQFGASRMTVHRAISDLAAEGLVRRNRRAGTIATSEARGRAVFEIWDIGADVRRAGCIYSFEVLSRRLRAAGAEDARRLAVPRGARVVAITTRHLSDDVPVQVEERLINLAAAAGAEVERFVAAPPGRWLLDHVPWTEAEHAISAENAPARIAERLGITAGNACLVVERRTWNGETPVTFARLWHPGARHRLVGRFSA